MAQGRGLSAVKRRLKLSKRTWQIVGVTGAVVLLALVVLVSSALSKPGKSQSPEIKAIAQQMESETLTDQGLTAMSSNESATAESFLRRAVALNPQNQRAVTALAQLRQTTTSGSTGSSGGSSSSGGSTSGGKPTGSSSGTGSKPKPPPPPAGDVQVANLGTLLPATAAGFNLYTPVVWGADAEVAGEVANKSSVHVVWTVHDKRTSSAARTYVQGLRSTAYPSDSSTATIDGAAAYVGSDGTRIVVTAYSRGRYVFEVLVSLQSVQDDLSPYFAVAQDAARAFPDKP